MDIYSYLKPHKEHSIYLRRVWPFIQVLELALPYTVLIFFALPLQQQRQGFIKTCQSYNYPIMKYLFLQNR